MPRREGARTRLRQHFLANGGRVSTSSSGLIQAGVALAAALVAVLYPIGYTLLVARLAFAYTHSLPTAWYAASLVPAPIVLGQVFGFNFLLALPMTAAFLYIERIPAPTRREWPGTRSRILIAVVVVVAVVALIVTHQFQFIVGMAFGAVVGIGTGVLENLRRANRISSLTRLGALAGVLYVGITALGLAPPVNPSTVLPEVDLTGVHLSGARVLAHTDSYRYVFTSDGVLHAIPDSVAGEAVIEP